MRTWTFLRGPLFCLPFYSRWPTCKIWQHSPKSHHIIASTLNPKCSFYSKVPNLTIQTTLSKSGKYKVLSLIHSEAQLLSINEPVKLKKQVICSQSLMMSQA